MPNRRLYQSFGLSKHFLSRVQRNLSPRVYFAIQLFNSSKMPALLERIFYTQEFREEENECFRSMFITLHISITLSLVPLSLTMIVFGSVFANQCSVYEAMPIALIILGIHLLAEEIWKFSNWGAQYHKFYCIYCTLLVVLVTILPIDAVIRESDFLHQCNYMLVEFYIFVITFLNLLLVLTGALFLSRIIYNRYNQTTEFNPIE